MHRTWDFPLPRLHVLAQKRIPDEVRREGADSRGLVAIEMADLAVPQLAANRPVFDPELESTFLRTGWVPRRRV